MSRFLCGNDCKQTRAENDSLSVRHHDQLGRSSVTVGSAMLFPSLSDSVIHYYLVPVTSGADLKGMLAVTNGHHLLG